MRSNNWVSTIWSSFREPIAISSFRGSALTWKRREKNTKSLQVDQWYSCLFAQSTRKNKILNDTWTNSPWVADLSCVSSDSLLDFMRLDRSTESTTRHKHHLLLEIHTSHKRTVLIFLGIQDSVSGLNEELKIWRTGHQQCVVFMRGLCFRIGYRQ